jgi:hypothetical protein
VYATEFIDRKAEVVEHDFAYSLALLTEREARRLVVSMANTVLNNTPYYHLPAARLASTVRP